MLKSLYNLARTALFALNPEDAHEATLKALECGLHPRPFAADDPILRQTVFGLDFPNPVGIAAGFDKDARVADAVLAMGCGFAEAGTLTPKPQPGNPKPRIFRLVTDQGLINRLGFNNGGHAAALARLEARKGRGGIVGVNIGANKDSADRAGDYVAGIEAFNAVASYFTVNISSPNTPGLRDLQFGAALESLLQTVRAERDVLAASAGRFVPLLLKIAPDLAEAEVVEIADALLRHGWDGAIATNTTLSREGVADLEHAGEAGGLSGKPLLERSTRVLGWLAKEVRGRFPLIGVGGIGCGEDAAAKIRAGASLVQVYSGFIYRGPGLIGQCAVAARDAAAAT